ncbi:hypothetical protein J6590_082532 [Homalodisca vitripennis]|nr:hypothetical protein J6590_082532 [Homalodisca vitripennis]
MRIKRRMCVGLGEEVLGHCERSWRLRDAVMWCGVRGSRSRGHVIDFKTRSSGGFPRRRLEIESGSLGAKRGASDRDSALS